MFQTQVAPERGFAQTFRSEPYLVIISAILLTLGLVMVYSTTGILSEQQFGEPFRFVKKQLIAAVLGLIGFFIALRIRPDTLYRISLFCLPLCLVLLILPLLPGMSHSAGGASRWIRFGFFQLQTGEFAKLALIIFMAGFFKRHEEHLEGFKYGVAIPFGIVAVCGVLFLMQPDFGSLVIISTTVLMMAVACGAKLRYALLMGLIGLAAFSVLVIISPYRMARVMSFLNPFADASGQGYQLIQSLLAVGSGELAGVGIGDSQQKLFFLPAAHTDFIFAVIAEELGFLGALFVLALFVFFFVRGVMLAWVRSAETFQFSLALGLTALIALPAFVNMGVVLGLLPTKGLVLPLLGYGGSNLIVSLTTIGLLLSIARSR